MLPLIPYSSSRRKQAVISRLRLGHTNLIHSYIFNRMNPNNCDEFNKYRQERQRFKITPILSELLGESCPTAEIF